MTFRDAIFSINSLLPNSELFLDADLMLEDQTGLLFSVTLSSDKPSFIVLRFQVFLSKVILKEKVWEHKSTVTPPVENVDIQKFVKHRNIQLLPYLKEYNNSFTDYDKLAELYIENRGLLIGGKFGF